MNKQMEMLNKIAYDLRVLLVAVSLGILLTACDPRKDKDGVSPETSEAARSALVSWLECEECTENQLKTVLKYSQHLQPMLVSTLMQGAAPASKSLYRYELERRYDELVVYAKTHPKSRPTLSKNDFVELYMGNLDAQYQTRAAQALAEIGGDSSRKALDQALNANKRDDVKQVIESSLKKMR